MTTLLREAMREALKSAIADIVCSAALAGIKEEEAISVLLQYAAQIALDTRKEHPARVAAWLALQAGREVQVAARNRLRVVESAPDPATLYDGRAWFDCDVCTHAARLPAQRREYHCEQMPCRGIMRHRLRGPE